MQRELDLGWSQLLDLHGDAHYQSALRLALTLDAQPLILDLLVSLAEHWLTVGQGVCVRTLRLRCTARSSHV